MNKRRYIYQFMVVAVFAAPYFASADCAQITRTLKIGVKGEDVRALQQVLNSDPDTLVAQSGAGSVGSETTTFGPATLRAVQKFQLKHRDEVLTPAGLVKATGVVGSFSRGVLNKLACANGLSSSSGSSSLVIDSPAVIDQKIADRVAASKQSIDDIISALTNRISSSNAALAARDAERQASNSLANTGMATSTTTGTTTPLQITGTAGKYPLQLFTSSPMVALRGTTINVAGTGFSGNTKILIGSTQYNLNPSTLSDNANFVIPGDFALGKYTVSLEDGAVISNSRILVVTDDLNNPPTITGISPSSGNVGTIFTITGQRFADQNDIVTGVNTIHDVASSDGKNISFTLSADSKLLNRDGKIMPYLPYHISIVNKFGISTFYEIQIR